MTPDADPLPSSPGRCRYCAKPRPHGYTITCGNSYCQEQDYNDNMARAKYRRPRRKKVGSV